MPEKSTRIVALGAAIAERPDREVGPNKIKKCLRNRVRYKGDEETTQVCGY
jgi:hypothetical protein